jgi:hypothetical protein
MASIIIADIGHGKIVFSVVKILTFGQNDGRELSLS